MNTTVPDVQNDVEDLSRKPTDDVEFPLHDTSHLSGLDESTLNDDTGEITQFKPDFSFAQYFISFTKKIHLFTTILIIDFSFQN